VKDRRDDMTKTKRTTAAKPPKNVCFGCGPDNSGGMHLKFAVEGEGETIVVRGRLRMPTRYQGSRKILHGGIVALLMDEAMGKFNRVDEIVAPTGELSVRYLRPVPVGQKILVEARRLRQEGRNYWRECTIHNAEGKLLARGEGRFVKIGDHPVAGGQNGVKK
jgi:uncharacterized protein (TIGR00369 family)